MLNLSRRFQHGVSPIYCWGYSLGGAVVSYLADTYPGVVYSSRLHSINILDIWLHLRQHLEEMGSRRCGSSILKVSFHSKISSYVVPTKLNSRMRISNVETTPILFLSSLHDEHISPRHMKSLYKVCKSDSKVMIEFANCNHSSNKYLPLYWEAIEEFVAATIQTPLPPPNIKSFIKSFLICRVPCQPKQLSNTILPHHLNF